MADFRQFALEFVLADDEAKLTSIAKQAASELQSGSASTNPVARWVEAVQPWMPGSNGDENMGDSDESPDWTGRAKALEFLSRTLDFLGKDVLKPSQVKLLVSFFGAMFDVDHKAGVLPSATALTRIAAMKSFQPGSADDIIQKLCALKDDFPRQVAKTRLAVFELLRDLVTSPVVASDLQHKHGASSGFMVDLLQLCKNERDPNCLMVWFDILSYFLREYSPSQDVIEEVYGTFKAYFPITLPRTSQSGITPEELKLQLRKCFTSNHKLAALTLPFLLSRLDQGEGVTVNVKVDILRTIKACLEEYSNPEQSVAPYADNVWSSLKYEVRNGEIEDTIWATLECLKTLATRLKGDNLRDYCLTVTRDCTNDFPNALYAAAAGRLLVGVLSASPSTFVLMVSPAITNAKENLRHPKGPGHSQDLLKLLHVILETRLMLSRSEMTAQEKSDFAAIDPSFKSLYDDVYRKPVELALKDNVSQDDQKLAAQAVQGAGSLVCQQPVTAVSSPTEISSTLLLSGDKCLEICDVLFSIIARSVTADASQTAASDDLVNETTKALQRAITAYTPGYAPLVRKSLDIIRGSWKGEAAPSASTIQTIGPLLAFIGCSELPSSPAAGLGQFLLTVRALYTELTSAIETKASFEVWCALIAGLQAAVRCFNDAFSRSGAVTQSSSFDGSWSSNIVAKYPVLNQEVLGEEESGVTSKQDGITLSEAYDDYLLISLHITKQLYRKATKAAEEPSGLQLSEQFNSGDLAAQNQYLYLLGSLAGYVIHELNEQHQISLKVHTFALNLFQDELVQLPSAGSSINEMSNWDWLIAGRLNILSYGIFETLRPSSVSLVFDSGLAQNIIIRSVTSPVLTDSTAASVSRAILTILANKHKIETVESVMAALDKESDSILQTAEADATTLEKATSLYAVAAGLLRRYSGKLAQNILRLLREAPGSRINGQHLARRLEMIVAPQKFLTKENFAIVKPLSVQKLYIELVKPMSAKALSQDVEDRVVKTNFSIAALLMVKHMSFSIYEEDAESIIRIAITVSQTIAAGPDARAALDVLRNILVEAPEKGKPHLGSIIAICVNAFSSKPYSPPEWLPSNYAPQATDAESQAASAKLALEIMGGLPKMFESRHLLPQAKKVERELTLACGNAVRDLRKTARAARSAWSEMR